MCLGTIEAVGFNRMPNRIGMDLELTGDRADLAVLGKEQMTNLHTGFCADHRRHPKTLGFWQTDRRNDHFARTRRNEERADAVRPTPSATPATPA
jgi:hypothetical protein